MRLEFWGAAREVTGSMHLLQVGSRKVLVDCGMYQGRRKGAFERNRNLPFDAASVDAVLLTHAHLDHAGNLPSLVRSGFRGAIWSTRATADLCGTMLADSAHIQESDVRYVNRRRRRQGKRPFEPLYTAADVRRTMRLFEGTDYGAWFEPVPGVRARFHDAGHILGSASIEVEASEGSRTVRIAFSGDVGRKGLPILRDPEVPAGADYVVLESTYGNRHHEPPSRAKEFLLDCARSACEKGGKLLIPSFALGRTQEIVYRLNQLWEEGALPQIDVFVDSPLAINVTEAFQRHPECWDREMLETRDTDSDGDPLGFRRLRYVREAEESKTLNTRKGPAIIIAASGMCEAGRILHHLLNHAGKPNTTILFVGYQAEHTLGRRILEGKSPVPVFGEEVEIRARVERADAYSAHADREELLAWAERARETGSVQRYFLVHGEPESAEALAGGIRAGGAAPVEVPERGAGFEL
ncbi:MAG: MBL fold metallo-hydrolase [Gemmatimonadota bacterium]|nr:MBL fold metallo-hydrolase [Gemmatimonadota bacterium]